MQKVVETKASFFYFYRLKEGNFCLSDICDDSNLKSEQPTQTLDVKNRQINMYRGRHMCS